MSAVINGVSGIGWRNEEGGGIVAGGYRNESVADIEENCNAEAASCWLAASLMAAIEEINGYRSACGWHLESGYPAKTNVGA